jgi:hypothetical protein
MWSSKGGFRLTRDRCAGIPLRSRSARYSAICSSRVGQVGAGLPVAAVLAFVEDLATLAACLYQQPLGGLVHAGAPVGELGEKSLGDLAGHRNAPVFLGITNGRRPVDLTTDAFGAILTSESRLPVPGSALAPTRWMSE